MRPNALDEVSIQCPCCWESISVLIDCSIESQQYVEDCQVCCRPIEFDVQVDDAGQARVSVSSDES